MAVYDQLFTISDASAEAPLHLEPGASWQEAVDVARIEYPLSLDGLRGLGAVAGQYAGLVGAHKLATKETLIDNMPFEPPLNSDESEVLGMSYVRAYRAGALVAGLVSAETGVKA